MSKFYNYSFSFSDLRIDDMVDTVHVSRSMERNRDIGAKDFYMVQMSSGELEYRGTLNLQHVFFQWISSLRSEVFVRISLLFQT